MGKYIFFFSSGKKYLHYFHGIPFLYLIESSYAVSVTYVEHASSCFYILWIYGSAGFFIYFLFSFFVVNLTKEINQVSRYNSPNMETYQGYLIDNSRYEPDLYLLIRRGGNLTL